MQIHFHITKAQGESPAILQHHFMQLMCSYIKGCSELGKNIVLLKDEFSL